MAASPRKALERVSTGAVLLGRSWLDRLVSVQLVDRAAALAGLAFAALVRS